MNNLNFKDFGVMLDCSRNAVMKVSALKKFISVISDMGYNFVELYTEDTYKISDEPYFGYMRGGYSAEEISELDAFAKSRGVELIPAVQTLAHFTNLVKLPHYADIVDVDDILLIGDEKTYSLIDKMFAFVSKAYSSKKVNIGMDEAHMAGLGKYLDEHGYCDRINLLLNHLIRVADIAKKYGLTLYMWSDMFFRITNGGEYYVKNPKIDERISAKIPDNVFPVYWDYYHENTEDYDAMFCAHKMLKNDLCFAGGAWSWVGFAPSNAYAIKSMRAAVKSAVNAGAKRFCLTMWGDNGKECSFFALIPALFAISCFARGEFDDEKIAARFKQKFGVAFNDFLSVDLPNVLPVKNAEVETCAKSLLYCDPFMGIFDDKSVLQGKMPYKIYARILKNQSKKTGEYGYIFSCLSDLCNVLDIKANLGVRIRAAYESGDKQKIAAIIKDIELLKKRLKRFISSFLSLWETENKPFGSEVHQARLGGLLLRIEVCKNRLEKYLETREPIEELHEKILPFFGNDAIALNVYKYLVSFSEI